MSQNTLEHQLKEFYQQQKLANKKLQHLFEMDALHQTDSPLPQSLAQPPAAVLPSQATGSAWLWVASMLFVLLLSVLQMQSENVDQRVAKEIALNHNKHLNVEFKTPHVTELNSVMHKLDFQLTTPSQNDVSRLQLVGARYCSIQGNLAAQLQLRNAKGEHYTLYQTPVVDDIQALRSQTWVVDGVEIRHWQEAGLFFGLAGPVNTSAK
ncbi:MAG: hypothetical protein OEZ58_17320 [Gammaproteobacteria bacterium]|nr:hypothetical protein [Gammaproteobacteria bacterium]